MLQKRNLQKIKSNLRKYILSLFYTEILNIIGAPTTNSTEQHIERRSPKRQSRSVTAKDRKSISGNESLTRRPRPCTYAQDFI